jgi:Tfp pilus assembly protein PilF
MLNPAQASVQQKKRFFELMENYCMDNDVDYSIFADKELEQRCLATQIDVLVKKMDRLPDRQLSYGYLGNLYPLKGLPDEAQDYYTKASQMGPLSAQMHHNLGVALIEQGRVDEGIHQLLEAVRVDPGYVRPYLSLGYVLAEQGRLDEAIQHFNQALRLNPYFAGAHNNLGIALARNRKLEDGEDHFKEALRINPGFAGARNNLNRILALRKN